MRCVKGIVVGLIVGLLAPAAALADEFPSRGIELVAGYGPGGGHDTMLRTMAKIIQQEKIIKVPVSVINKPGGSSAVSLGYLNSHKGDGHYLMAATSTFITTPLTTNVGVTYKNFTPIARFGIDPELLVVPAKSPIKSLDDIKKAGRVLNVAGGTTGGIENITAMMLGEALGVKLNYVPYNGDGDVLSAVLSNQVDFGFSNVGAVAEFIKAGRLRALAISTEKRVDMFPNVPTFTEQGYDIVISVFRGVVAAGDIKANEKQYLFDLAKKVSETKAWKEKYLEANSIVPGFMGPDEFSAFLVKMEGVYKKRLTELGIIHP